MQTNMSQVRKIMEGEEINRDQLGALKKSGSLCGPDPTPSGHRDGEPYWTREDFLDWAETTKRSRSGPEDQKTVQERSAVLTAPTTRHHTVRAASLDDQERTFTAVVASETPVSRINFRSGRLVDEVLLVSAGIFPDSVPLLDAHRRESTSDIVGSVAGFRKEGTTWIGSGRVAQSDQLADAIWSKIRDGHLTSLSIGYSVTDSEEVQPGETKSVAGRTFTNRSDRSLHIVTSWRVHEVSLVPIPADNTAKIRSALKTENRSTPPMPTTAPAIHSRNSLTDQPSIGTLISSLLIRNGVDPLANRVAFPDSGRRPVRLPQSDRIAQEAELGQSFVSGSIMEVVRLAAELDGVHSVLSDRNGNLFGRLRSHYDARSFVGSNLEALFSAGFAGQFLASFDSLIDSTLGWVSDADNLSFRDEQRVRATNISQLKERARGGKADVVEFVATSEPTQIASYCGLFEVTEFDLMDNTFGNLDGLTPKLMGQAAARLRVDLVLGLLLSNPVMRDGKELFHADHGNLQSASPIGGDTIASSAAMLAKQDDYGTPLNLRSRYLIVPQASERVAQKAVREVELVTPGSTPAPLVRSESRIDNGVTDPKTNEFIAGEPSSWYMAADSGSSIEVQYLAGAERQPEIRSGMLREGEFGVWFDVQHFIGARAIDWRGLVKSEA